MKLGTIIVLVSQRKESTGVQKWKWDFFEMPQGGHQMMQDAAKRLTK